jgi:adenine-specific DNA-methyltransferase
MTNKGDWVFDPFLGTGTSIIAAILHKRRGVGAETEDKYVKLAKNRIVQAGNRTLKTRPMNKPEYGHPDNFPRYHKDYTSGKNAQRVCS